MAQQKRPQRPVYPQEERTAKRMPQRPVYSGEYPPPHRSATGGTFAHSAASQANGFRRAGALAAAHFPHRHSAAGGSCHAAAARAAAHLA